MSDARRYGVFGASGSGKSFLAKRLAAPHPRLIVFDVYRDTNFRAQSVCYSMEDARRRLIRWYDRGFTLVYRPPYTYTDAEGRERDALAPALSKFSDIIADVAIEAGGRHELLFYVEEMAQCFPEERQPIGQRGFFKLCMGGRHHRIALLGVSQRPADVSKAFIGNLSDVYVFRPNGARDAAASKELIGLGAPVGVHELHNRDYLYRDATNGRVTHFKYK